MNISGETWYDPSKQTKVVVTDLLERGDTDLKDKEDEDNNISVDENVTEEGGDEHDLTDVEETVDCSSHEVLPTLGGAALCCVVLCWESRYISRLRYHFRRMKTITKLASSLQGLVLYDLDKMIELEIRFRI